MSISAKPKLPDGRKIRALCDGKKYSFTQDNIFGVAKLLTPSERIMSVKEHDASILSSSYYGVNVNGWWRADEYAFYHRDPTLAIGTELVWIEYGVRYRKIIPDVPVQFNGREISLQKVVGMGIYPSIGLLKVERTDEKEFTVSPVSLDAIAGKVRAMNFMRNGWAEPDGYGFPDGNMPSSRTNKKARCGAVRTDFDRNATGWHGSMARDVDRHGTNDRKLYVYALSVWSEASGVAIVNRERTGEPTVDYPIENGIIGL